MSIKPVEYQILIPKSSEVSKIQNDNQHKGTVMQQQQSALNQQKSEDSVNLVHSQENPQKALIKDKEKERKKKNKDKKRGCRKYKHRKNSEDKASTIDIRL
ncbi:hypothetical protein RBH29_05365 [Herbivorax sp. ANBcel31]|uniref:hypothetical protein n=1 Tax=Herbivorax sp. ANBcel31 TaxID=3069754 RepID=UPI0027B5AD21|nr:hypothetical protein [Herbivorax sp. ANBcel31]MDQ2085865.1 hypothetical protein [Herbivorax sp. ANBcel31]